MEPRVALAGPGTHRIVENDLEPLILLSPPPKSDGWVQLYLLDFDFDFETGSSAAQPGLKLAL